MNKMFGTSLAVICLVTSATAIKYHGEASRYRAELTLAQTEAIKLQSELATSASTVRVYSPATTDPAPETQAAASLEVPTLTETNEAGTRLRELEMEIQDKNRLIAALQQQKQVEQATNQRNQRSGQNWEEELKVSDPERYKEMIRQREEAKAKVQRSFAEKASHFLKQDTSDMTEDQAVAHEQMLKTLDETWALAEQLQGDTPRDQRWQIMRQMRDNMATLEPAMKEERTKEWTRLSTELGYTGNDATNFVTYLDKIVDVTSMSDIYQSMRRGRGGPGGGTSTNVAAVSK